jgi:hypothetical protein
LAIVLSVLLFWPLCCLSFSFGHCGVCPSSIYGFWLPLWYLQTLLTNREILYQTTNWYACLSSLHKNGNCINISDINWKFQNHHCY